VQFNKYGSSSSSSSSYIFGGKKIIFKEHPLDRHHTRTHRLKPT